VKKPVRLVKYLGKLTINRPQTKIAGKNRMIDIEDLSESELDIHRAQSIDTAEE
jgi:hypothetical protein